MASGRPTPSTFFTFGRTEKMITISREDTGDGFPFVVKVDGEYYNSCESHATAMLMAGIIQDFLKT